MLRRRRRHSQILQLTTKCGLGNLTRGGTALLLALIGQGWLVAAGGFEQRHCWQTSSMEVKLLSRLQKVHLIKVILEEAFVMRSGS